MYPEQDKEMSKFGRTMIAFGVLASIFMFVFLVLAAAHLI